MKWNGRSYRPINQIPIKKREFNMEEALRPLGQKMHDTHWVANVYKEPQTSPVPPTPTPTQTPTPTLTQTVTVTPTFTPTQTETPSQTPTPSPTTPIQPVSGFVDYFDAAFYTSGNTWDSQTTSLTFELFNNPTKISTNGGMISFDGVDDYALSKVGANLTTLIPNSSNWTIEAWYTVFTGNPAFVPTIIIRDGEQTPPAVGPTNNFVDGRNIFNVELRVFLNGTQSVGPILTLGTPIQIVYSYSAGTMTVYVNSVSVHTMTNAFTRSATRGTYLSMNGVDRSQVDFGIIRTYGSALNSAQVLQNFNANRNRFGL